MNLVLTIKQRLIVESIIRAEKATDNDDLFMLVDIKKKIGFKDDCERTQFMLTIPGVGMQFKEAVIAKTPDLAVDLEKAEVRRLEKLLQGKQFTPDDAEVWLFDLRTKMEALKA